LRIRQIIILLLLAGLTASLGACSKCGRPFWEQPQACGRE
jgi:hypothetical protein